jgi:hypothetical protein
MGELDVTFRRLLRTVPAPILRLAFPRRRIKATGELDPSVDRPRQRTADTLFRARAEGRNVAVHVEIERSWRPEMPHRLFEYASAAAVATRLPVVSIAVLLRPGGRPPRGEGMYRIPGMGRDAFVFRYRVLPLWRLEARQMRRQLGIVGAPFCAAMRGADETYVRELAADVQASRGLSEADRGTTLQLLYLVSATTLGVELARRIFHVESIIQDPNVQALIREWEDKGRAEGRAEERAEIAETARRMLREALAKRRWSVPPAVRARIDAEQDLEQLITWHAAALTAPSLADLFGGT